MCATSSVVPLDVVCLAQQWRPGAALHARCLAQARHVACDRPRAYLRRELPLFVRQRKRVAELPQKGERRPATDSMQPTTCNRQRVTDNMQPTTCNRQHATTWHRRLGRDKGREGASRVLLAACCCTPHVVGCLFIALASAVRLRRAPQTSPVRAPVTPPRPCRCAEAGPDRCEPGMPT